jgi:hypothetical protein
MCECEREERSEEVQRSFESKGAKVSSENTAGDEH